KRYGLGSRLKKYLIPQPGSPDFVHVGIVGHQGTGKTTQVRRAMEDLRPQGIRPIYVDALASFDQADFTFSDVILVLARYVIAALEDAQAEIPREQSELVELWFAEELLTETHKKDLL